MSDPGGSAFIRCNVCHGQGFVCYSPDFIGASSFGKCASCNGTGHHYLNAPAKAVDVADEYDLMLD